MKCPICGKDNPEAAQFCGVCGTGLSAPIASDIGKGISGKVSPSRIAFKWVVRAVIVVVGMWLATTFWDGTSPGGIENDQGITYFEQGDYGKAIEEFDEAIRLDPQMAEAYDNRGFAYEMLGQYERANEDYTKALELGYYPP